MNRIVVVGAGGHARVVADVIRLTGAFELHGFLDTENAERRGEAYEGSHVLGGHEIIAELKRDGVAHAAVAIGDNHARLRIGGELEQLGFVLPALAHPAATIAANVHLGAGCVVFAGAIINPATRIGRLAIINTAASVDHDCTIGDGAHIGPGVHLAGWVTVEEAALVGVGAAVRPRISIGRDAIVGAGAAVIGDVAPGTTVAGVPARILSS